MGRRSSVPASFTAPTKYSPCKRTVCPTPWSEPVPPRIPPSAGLGRRGASREEILASSRIRAENAHVAILWRTSAAPAQRQAVVAPSRWDGGHQVCAASGLCPSYVFWKLRAEGRKQHGTSFLLAAPQNRGAGGWGGRGAGVRLAVGGAADRQRRDLPAARSCAPAPLRRRRACHSLCSPTAVFIAVQVCNGEVR